MKNTPQIRRLLEDIRSNDDKKLTVFSIPGCPACEEFKSKVGQMSILYEDINMVDNDEMWTKLESMGGTEFVPQVMVEGTLILEYEDVNELLSKTISEMIGRKVIIK